MLQCFNGAGLIQPGRPEGRKFLKRVGRASMGPGLFSPEDQILSPRLGFFLVASMGPGLFSPEDLVESVRAGDSRPASMGPGLFSPEDRMSSGWKFRCVKLQWGRACSARKTTR